MDAFFPVSHKAMLVVIRFIVRTAHRGPTVPFELIAQGAPIAVRRGIELVFCDCQPHLINHCGWSGFHAYRQAFADHPGQVLSRQELLSMAQGMNFDPGTNLVDV
jgi:hypothetical protein